ncbi:MAG: hypothetical protein K2K69_06920 [Muribaculaceae bacterium]|nr:hypothetical protein [Muribaculaceae bacterium]
MMKKQDKKRRVAEAMLTAIVGLCCGSVLAVVGLELTAPAWVMPVCVAGCAGIFLVLPIVVAE